MIEPKYPASRHDRLVSCSPASTIETLAGLYSGRRISLDRISLDRISLDRISLDRISLDRISPTKAAGPMDRPAEDFDAYVRARTPALIRTAYLLTGDQHRAEDLVQDALIKTYRAWPRLRGSNPDAYTRTVMYHLNISWWRRGRSAEVSTDQPPDVVGGPDESGRSLNRLALRAALSHLTPRQRAVVVLRFFEDVTEVDAAQMLGVTVGTIKSTTSRALLKLRAIAPYLLDAEGARR